MGIIAGLLLPWIAGVQAQDVGSGGIGGRPAYPRDDNARSESIFIHTVEAGQGVDDGVRVINNTAEVRTVEVYAADSIVSSGGAFACEQFVDEDNEVGSWISLERSEATLEPSSSEIIDFTINVPADADVGEHDGCIVVQEKKPISENEQGIGLSFRTAIRVALLVPGDIVKSLEITDFQTVINTQEIILTPFIQNSGNVSIDADITTRLSCLCGWYDSSAGGRFPVLRGQTGEWNFQHDRPFWGGILTAEVMATYDASTDTFLGVESGEVETITYDTVRLFIVPHPLALAIELTGLALIIFLIWLPFRRKRRRKKVQKQWSKHTVKKGEDIRILAQSHNISWKQLAKANKLKAPYTLEPGTTIRLPKKRQKAATKSEE